MNYLNKDEINLVKHCSVRLISDQWLSYLMLRQKIYDHQNPQKAEKLINHMLLHNNNVSTYPKSGKKKKKRKDLVKCFPNSPDLAPFQNVFPVTSKTNVQSSTKQPINANKAYKTHISGVQIYVSKDVYSNGKVHLCQSWYFETKLNILCTHYTFLTTNIFCT